MLKLITNSPQETISLGKRIARALPLQVIVALCGRLGSGKTTFVKGIASGLGIDPRTVNSPSYVLIKEYISKRRNLFHCDLYRLNRRQDIAFLGIEDYFSRKGFFIIEWAEKAKGFLPDEYLRINIRTLALNKRRFDFAGKGVRYEKVIQKIKQQTKKNKQHKRG